MKNEYTLSEVIEIGQAQDVIQGPKVGFPPDTEQLISEEVSDLDE